MLGLKNMRHRKNKIKCPHCSHIWELTEKQALHNSKFKCPKCKKYNIGNMKSIKGVMIGMTYSQLKECDEESAKRILARLQGKRYKNSARQLWFGPVYFKGDT